MLSLFPLFFDLLPLHLQSLPLLLDSLNLLGVVIAEYAPHAINILLRPLLNEALHITDNTLKIIFTRRQWILFPVNLAPTFPFLTILSRRRLCNQIRILLLQPRLHLHFHQIGLRLLDLGRDDA